MKASEARQLAKQADEATQAAENAQYDKIMVDIRLALSKDECYHIYWYKTMSNRLIFRLQADGYSVTNESNYNAGTSYKISWAE